MVQGIAHTGHSSVRHAAGQSEERLSLLFYGADARLVVSLPLDYAGERSR